MEVLLIDRGTVDDIIAEIAKIHRLAYSKEHFTESFGSKKLIEYNQSLVRHADVTLVAMDGAKVAGFLIAGFRVSFGVKEFIRNNRLWLISRLAMQPSFFLQKASGILKSKFRKTTPSKAKFRLLSVAVDPAFQGSGVGRLLFSKLEDELQRRNIEIYGLSVRSINTHALDFYKKFGFSVEREEMGSIYLFKQLRGKA